MEQTKEQLQAKIEALQTQLNNLTHEIQREQKALEDLNKPVLTSKAYDTIVDTIRNAIYDVRFSEDDFEVELSMGYDNKVEIENLEFNSSDSLADDVIRHIDNQFRVEEEVESSLSSNTNTDNE
tara:strand:- start:72 stop:443 length:372 start_codon:yes stop_codon:yes gene_type:complete